MPSRTKNLFFPSTSWNRVMIHAGFFQKDLGDGKTFFCDCSMAARFAAATTSSCPKYSSSRTSYMLVMDAGTRYLLHNLFVLFVTGSHVAQAGPGTHIVAEDSLELVSHLHLSEHVGYRFVPPANNEFIVMIYILWLQFYQWRN